MEISSLVSYFGKSKNSSGFTLIEMAVVLVIVGIIISIVSTIMPTLLKSAKIKKTQAILEKTNYAVQGYLVTTNNLPYADSDQDGVADDGVFFGWLPYKTLGLSSGDDTWRNRLKYGVYDDVTTTDICDVTPPETVDVAKLHTVNNDDATTTQQLYVIISGGDPRGTFEGKNADNDAEYDDPDRILEYNGDAVVFNDLMEVGGITPLKGRTCTGSSSGVGSTTAEDEYADGCTDGVDNDADGKVDCDDQDCINKAECTSPVCNITTTQIPQGYVNTEYLATFQAAGGTPPYEWTLAAHGGLSDLYLHPYTGQLTGTINNCPGNYTIQVQLNDSDTCTDTASFTLVVASDITVVRTSGDGSTSITWSDADQEETFRANGGFLGNINWDLNTGGATGFIVQSTGTNTCKITKSTATTAGTYTFTLTATDSQCPGNTGNISLNLIVEASAAGPPATGEITDSLIDQFDYDSSSAREPDMIHVSGDIFAIAYFEDDNDDGEVKTVEIDENGEITDSVLDTLQFDGGNARTPDIIHVSGDYYAIAWFDDDANDGVVTTIEIAPNGQITNTVVDTLIYDTGQAKNPSIVHVSGDYFAIAYFDDDSDDGVVKTIEINSTGQITNTVVDTLIFDTGFAYDPDMINTSGNYFAIAYNSSDVSGVVKTIEIDTNGQITNTVVDSLTYHSSQAKDPKIISVSGDYYAIAFDDNTNGNGVITTIEIDSTGQINGTVDTLTYNTNPSRDPDMINTAGTYYAVVYFDDAIDDCILKTIEIGNDGLIADAVVDTITIETSTSREPSIVHVAGEYFAIAYFDDTANDGELTTIEIK